MKRKRWKRNRLIRRGYVSFKKLLTRLSPVLATKVIYRVALGRRLDLKHPRDFNQKIMWLKLNTYYHNPLVTQCADKVAVREYVRMHGCGEALNELVGVWDCVNEIEWDRLPESFVLKCNHGCGMNIICTQKRIMNREAVLRKLDAWMQEDYYLENAEVNYRDIRKKILCEKYLETSDGLLPNDYKIYCFDGKPELVLVCCERDVGLQRIFLDLNWKPVAIGRDGINRGMAVKKPASFDRMVEYSRKLSEGFPFVRMDFYDVDGRAVFGEMTFTPAGGLGTAYSDYGLKYLGDLIKLPVD